MTVLSGCRGTAGIEFDTLECIQDFETARLACLAQFPDVSSTDFMTCIEAARQEAGQCRATNLRIARGGFCRHRFDACRKACSRTTGIDVEQCRLDFAQGEATCESRCMADEAAALELCNGRAADCALNCETTLTDCADAVSRTERPQVLACKAAFAAAVGACRAVGSPRPCIIAAKDDFFICGGPPNDSAAPAFVGCDLDYDDCVDTCPPS